MRIVILLALLAATAHAGNNELMLGDNIRALRTRSANALTEDSLVGGSLGYARALDVALLSRLSLWIEGSFGWGAADGAMFQTLTTEIDTLSFTAGARARYALHRLVVASAHLDLGTMRAGLVLHDDAGHTGSAHGWGAMTTAGAALDLYAIRGIRYALALRAEIAAVATSSIPLAAHPTSGSEGALTLEMTAASLGSLNLSGPSFAVSLVGQF